MGNNARAGFFEREAFEAVLEHLPDYLKPVMVATYLTGWRTKSELLTRTWRHVNFETGWLTLDPDEGKTREARSFPLIDELREVLLQQRERVRELEKSTGQIIPWVFVHYTGQHGVHAGDRVKGYRHAWEKACRDAGLPEHVVHDFRRSAVRNLERAAVPRSAAMRMTGHKTESIYRRYAIVDEGMMRDAAAKLTVLHASDKTAAGGRKVVPINGEPKKSAAVAGK